MSIFQNNQQQYFGAVWWKMIISNNSYLFFLQLTASLFNITAGPLLGLFTLGMLSRRANWKVLFVLYIKLMCI